MKEQRTFHCMYIEIDFSKIWKGKECSLVHVSTAHSGDVVIRCEFPF